MLNHYVHSDTSTRRIRALHKFHFHQLSNNLPWHNLNHDGRVVTILNYITHLRSSSDATRGSIATFCQASSWAHRASLSPGPAPADNELVVNYRKAIERSFDDTPIKKRFPFTRNQTRGIALTALSWARGGRPQYYRIYVLIVLSYKAATRISELLALTRGNVIVAEKHLRFNFLTRKNKKRREACLSFVQSEQGSPLCPVNIVRLYLQDMGLLHPPTNDTELPAFNSRYVFPGGRADVLTGHPISSISYKSVYEQLKTLLLSMDMDPSKFGWHSPRSSAITDMQTAGMSDEAISRHTGHRDIKSLESYKQGTLSSRLAASGHLSL